MSAVDNSLRDVAQALRDPSLSLQESQGLACLMIVERCSLREAHSALARIRSCYAEAASFITPDQMLPMLKAHLQQIRPRRRKVVLVPAEGKPTNIIRCPFELPDQAFADGVLRARVLSVKQVAYIKSQRTKAAKADRRANV